MDQSTIEKVKSLPQYHQLVKERTSLAWKLSITMLVVYYGYVMLLAFNPDFFKIVVAGEHTTIGFPIGVGIILFAFALTGVYVKKANADFDDLTAQIKREVGE
ncbi:DUF485 domain-containing protein [Thiosulfativibrio zosterae]|uniref:Membrane protein n=1 Tax=Thiosulfativibrio zosterae TaxID=2675053 RepID=A0A6F8PNC4_9GAMM|nr:DUF485 domain-containing protein [Thiosulfativibrio zosterae]BBP43609.1 membrane protein [Thiosulfativibrio zosterae]